MTPILPDPVTVLVFAADVSVVHFNDASKLVGLVLAEASADTRAHIVCRLVAPEAHVAHDLQCAHSLFAGQHQVNDFEPLPERLVGVFEDRSDQDREPIAASDNALGALPMEGPVSHRVHVHIPAPGAVDAFGPAARNEVGFASFLVREHAVKLLICKLFYRLNAGHDGLPESMVTA
jgi:hypothetical protein